jgi:chaperonin GroES
MKDDEKKTHVVGPETTRFKPFFGKILVLRDPDQDKTRGGIILPDQAKKKPQRGKIIAVGEGDWLADKQIHGPMFLEPGDVVWFTNYMGNDIQLDGVDYLIMGQCDILAVSV